MAQLVVRCCGVGDARVQREDGAASVLLLLAPLVATAMGAFAPPPPVLPPVPPVAWLRFLGSPDELPAHPRLEDFAGGLPYFRRSRARLVPRYGWEAGSRWVREDGKLRSEVECWVARPGLRPTGLGALLPRTPPERVPFARYAATDHIELEFGVAWLRFDLRPAADDR